MAHNSKPIAKYLIGLFVTITVLSCNFSSKEQQSTNNTQKRMNWFPLTDVTQLTEITEESFKHPVLIFKYSTTCSISATAKGRLERNWDTTQVGNLKTYYLDLLKYRAISNQIAQTFHVEHESPQVLIIENGKCVYHESHLGINFAEISEQLSVNSYQ